MDDALVSRDNAKDIVTLIKRTQNRLTQGGNIRLHKILSNSTDVVSSFAQKDLAEGITEIDFDSQSSCLQRSLGLNWDVIRDIFTYQLSADVKPYTKRGVLSVINGIFDPLGFIAPVILGGRLLLRQAIQNNSIDWDDLLPNDLICNWQKWRQSLKDLELLEIRRSYTSLSLNDQDCTNCELHIFSDASKEAIASVAYIRTYDENGEPQVGFVLGKSKLAPSHGHTIPRLELCAAVLSTEIATFVQKQLKIPPSETYFYTDSQVVLGYLYNETRRFYVYVSNRVDKILKVSSKLKWNYVPTTLNPADHGTRPLEAKTLGQSNWLIGPKVFLESHNVPDTTYRLLEPETDKEVRPLVQTMKTLVKPSSIGTSRLSRASVWSRLLSAMTLLKRKAALYRKTEKDTRTEVDFIKETEVLILKEFQQETYSEEIYCLQNNKPLPKDSNLIALSPVLDSNGLLRVGGRLRNAKLETGEKLPVIISGKTHVATLLVRHFHESVQHQGRHYTEGIIRSKGFWITGGKRLINSILHKCVKCRRLRGRVEQQKMAELPVDRVTPSPPFTYVGVDTFGPWSVVTRRTRGGIANAKRWAIMFSCLVTRAIHIEIVEEMTSSSFINSLRRFTAIRGPVKELRSDKGTNFVGAVNELGIHSVNVEDPKIKNFLCEHKTICRFNPPHASHMSGAWERMIGLARKILDSMLCDIHGKQLTHEVLCTLMTEVCCIVNSRPITVVSNDPESPTVLTPNVLLTQKIDSDVKPLQDFSMKDMYQSQWKHVQLLADQFWKRWRTQYLHNLQSRQKWHVEGRNLQTGDIVTMIDDDLPRYQWPVGIVETIFPSSDGLVRKASVRVIRKGEPVTYTRPICKLIYLFSD